MTICPIPFIIGGSTAPTLSDGVGFDAKTLKQFKLANEEVHGDEVYLHYILK